MTMNNISTSGGLTQVSLWLAFNIVVFTCLKKVFSQSACRIMLCCVFGLINDWHWIIIFHVKVVLQELSLVNKWFAFLINFVYLIFSVFRGGYMGWEKNAKMTLCVVIWIWRLPLTHFEWFSLLVFIRHFSQTIAYSTNDR